MKNMTNFQQEERKFEAFFSWLNVEIKINDN